jgi:sugar (pentulose or hexulose) kinase
MSFIGIDLGTSFIKGAVLDLETRQLGHVRRMPFPPQLANTVPLACEFDPRAILEAVQGLIAELAFHAPHCEGIVMCSQMHGLVLTNGRGEPVSNCITWRDQRVTMPHPAGSGSSYYEVLTRRIPARQVSQIGNELDPGRPLCYLFWFAEQGKLAPGLVPVSLPDFVLSALCHSEPGVEATNAGAYGALNLGTLNWHAELIDALGLGNLRWPELRKTGDVVGYLDVNGARVPCYTPVGDYQCALVGALFDQEEVSLNIATGSQVSRMTLELALGDYQTRPFFGGRFLNLFSYPPGGRSLNVLVDLISNFGKSQDMDPGEVWDAIARAAEEVPDTDLEVDLSFFAASRENRGHISNIRGDNLTPGHLFRGAFEYMAGSFHDCALRLFRDRSWKNLLFSGGLACKLEILRRIVQQKFGASYRMPPFEEDTLFGLLILASVFTGRAGSVAELTRELRATG